MMTYILFILGFLLLIKGADFLVDGSASIAHKLKISPIVIGLTIVAFGTSAPEFIVNIFASINGNTEIAIGNILGSNIANILLILGISAIIDGIVLLAFFVIFLYYTFGISKVTGEVSNDDIQELSYIKSVLFVLTGLLGLVVGGKWIVGGAVTIAETFNVSQSLIGLTVVAIGTSLPELATSAIAAYKKQTDIAIGNVVGSNIFNIFWILGFSALIRPLPFSRSSDVDILMTILASAILFFIMFVGKKHVIERWQGVLMVLLYLSYVTYLVFTR
ncbi:MAG: Na+/Ca+ antiporter, CaCA family [Parcubacteria group bacterium GW2011_GWA2_43_11]|nr:MAG: Na+/Ca+ antiporter, CaCA family [Parcubacteria group bacterium GW2011_GWA2_43_11]